MMTKRDLINFLETYPDDTLLVTAHRSDMDYDAVDTIKRVSWHDIAENADEMIERYGDNPLVSIGTWDFAKGMP